MHMCSSACELTANIKTEPKPRTFLFTVEADRNLTGVSSGLACSPELAGDELEQGNQELEAGDPEKGF